MTIQLKDIALFILSVICVALLLSQCNSCTNSPKIADNKSIKDTIYKLQVKVDSIDVVRLKYVSKWRVLRDTINIRDTVQVVTALNKCDTIIKIDSTEIATLKIINRNFYKLVKSDSLVIDSLTRSKKKYWRGFKHGMLAGVAASTLIYGSVIGK